MDFSFRASSRWFLAKQCLLLLPLFLEGPLVVFPCKRSRPTSFLPSFSRQKREGKRSALEKKGACCALLIRARENAFSSSCGETSPVFASPCFFPFVGIDCHTLFCFSFLLRWSRAVIPSAMIRLPSSIRGAIRTVFSDRRSLLFSFFVRIGPVSSHFLCIQAFLFTPNRQVAATFF